MEILWFLPESSRSTHEKHVLSTLQEQYVDDDSSVRQVVLFVFDLQQIYHVSELM